MLCYTYIACLVRNVIHAFSGTFFRSPQQVKNLISFKECCTLDCVYLLTIYVWTCLLIVFYSIILTNKMHYFLLIYFNNKPLLVSSRLAAHHQEDRLCINCSWYSHALYWLVVGRSRYCQQPVNITYVYTSCCLYRGDPPDDEQQACSKHVEVLLLK